MPELPEVETTLRGLEPHITGKTIAAMVINRRDLRWPISAELPKVAKGQRVVNLDRRGKYLLFHLEAGHLISHLGMSGSIRIASINEPLRKHDHWRIQFDEEKELRFYDPRRFGALLWVEKEWQNHPLIASLGPEPLSKSFSGQYLFEKSRGRSKAIKTFIMDAKFVVGVGNIYASEALFHSGIHPGAASGKISKSRCELLVNQIQRVLSFAIEQGGTTLRDYVNGSGSPGYFQQELWVYGRKGEPCKSCGKRIKEIRLSQRSSCFCPGCQKR